MSETINERLNWFMLTGDFLTQEELDENIKQTMSCCKHFKDYCEERFGEYCKAAKIKISCGGEYIYCKYKRFYEPLQTSKRG